MAIDVNWILGIAIMFALALVLTKLTFNDLESFFIWLTIFAGFVVWSGLLPLWILIICLIIMILIIVNKIKKKSV